MTMSILPLMPPVEAYLILNRFSEMLFLISQRPFLAQSSISFKHTQNRYCSISFRIQASENLFAFSMHDYITQPHCQIAKRCVTKVFPK